MNDEEFKEMNREALSSAKMLAWMMVFGISVIVSGVLAVIYLATH